MGFRTYDPGLSRFTSRDLYLGARVNMGLTVDVLETESYVHDANSNVIEQTIYQLRV